MESSHRINSFDALRLLGAVLVIYGHGYVLAGQFDKLPVLGGLAPHVMGVVIFFTISGYLIWSSWNRRSSWQNYWAARFLRIIPALAVVVVLTTFVLGPLITTVSLGEYFASSQTWVYLTNIFMFDPQYQLPGVFPAQPLSDAVNGSLWTLRAEFICYIAVPFSVLLPKAARKFVLGAAALGLLWFGMTTDVVVLESNLTMAAFYWGFFAAGAFVAEVGLLRKASWPITALLLVVWLAFAQVGSTATSVLGLTCFAVAILMIGIRDVPVVRDAARFGDLSYGMYLVAFPIQQLLIQNYPSLELGWSMLLVTVISAALAMGLWWFVEAPSLRAKGALGGWLRRLTSRPV